MPLNYGKSKSAFSENVAKERGAGKPLPQALAIAYAVARGESKKPKHPEGASKTPKSRLNLTRKRSAQVKRTAHLRAARTSKQRAPHFARFVD